MKNRVLTVAAAAALLFGFAGTAAAQGTSTTTTPTFELSAGYQFLRTGEVCDEEDDELLQLCSPERNFPFGVAVDAARNFGRFAIVGEVGWSYKSENFSDEDDDIFDADVKFNTWHIAAGPRLNFGGDRFRPFVQVLAGIVQDRVSFDDELDVFEDDSTSQTSFMLQPGIGGTYVMGDGWGFVGQIDYRRIFLDEEENLSSGRNDIRVFVGVRMILD